MAHINPGMPLKMGNECLQFCFQLLVIFLGECGTAEKDSESNAYKKSHHNGYFCWPMAEIGKDINKAKQLLRDGELVAIPTETVYGLAGNALNVDAVTKIFKVKNRPRFDPLIIHVASLEDVRTYAVDVPEKARLLAEKFWPGPLTLLLKKQDIIPDLVTSGLSTVGIRNPDHALTRSLLNDLGFPLAAPSANPFGYVSPTTAEHVNDQLGEKISYILDGGPCQVGIESTIIGFETGRGTVYRSGGLRLEDIEEAIGQVNTQVHSTSNPQAPGQLQSHYAPSKKIIVGNLSTLVREFSTQRVGILSFRKNYEKPFQYILSPSGNLEEAARNIFSFLRAFDKLPVDLILAEFVPDEGLGVAINDRLRRAAF
jgi:L-threonylcarbamoyladenylate synthase